MKKLFLSMALAVFASLIISSCNKENFVEKFEVSTTQLNAKKEAEKLQFTLTSNVQWIISDNAEWIELSEYTGSGSVTVTISLSENTGFEERHGEVKIVVNGVLRETVKVSQLSDAPAILISPETKHFEVTGGKYELEIVSNTAWILDCDKKWVTFSKKEGEGNAKIEVTVEESEETQNRTAVITLTETYSHTSKTATITQDKAFVIINLDPDTKTADYKGETFDLDITLKPAVAWTIVSNKEWCILDKSGGTGNGKVSVTIQPNTGGKRDAIITVTAPNEEISTTLSVSQGEALTRASDSLALIDFYNATNGAGWSKNQWDLTKPIHTWSGITVANNRVTGLTIGSGVITSGTIPASIGNLDKLNKLSLTNTNLTGSLPEEIYKLTELTTLALNTNAKLVGDITQIFKTFKQLEVLNVMSNTNFTGTIPVEIGEITNLNTIYLSNTKVSGTIPAEIGNLTKLKLFGATNTQLEGSIPDIFNKLTALQMLQLNGCRFSGPLPKSLGQMTTTATLLTIWLFNNDFTGNIPEEWSGITTKCTQLRIQGNKLSGVVPAAVQNHAQYATWAPATYIYPQQTGYGLTNQ